MARIELTNVSKRWGHFYAVDHLDLTIDDNAFVTLLGPSGCGKTTTLRMIAGLETPTEGRITIDGVPVFDSERGINVSANARRVGFLFQNYALWPNMTVYQNIAFGLGNIKEEMDKADTEARAISAMLSILDKAGAARALVEESRDKDGKTDAQKAQLRLIDTYEISGMSAKALLKINLADSADVEKHKAALRQRLDALKEKHREKGETLSDDFTVLSGGKPVRSVRKLDKEEIDLAVRRVSRIVKIGMFMDRYPSELSGGQQQRVAIARTLAPGPRVLFMDEPLSNLDAKLRLEMRSELQRLHLETGSTFIYVTHDQMEAMTLATKICLIENGVLQQYDEPLTVYNRPSNLFVADFVGNPAVNFIEARGAQQGGELPVTIFGSHKAVFKPAESMDLAKWFGTEDERDAQKAEKAKAALKDKKNVEKGNKDSVFRYHIARVNEMEDFGDKRTADDNDFILGVRPEFLDIREDGALEAEVFSAMPTGMETTVKLRVDDFLLTGVVFGGILYKIGQKVRFSVRGDSLMLFSRKNGRMIAQGSIEIKE
ncbi:MAG: ATP-binding cassette domain-containing protein [Eubacteriales bacterium]|nr:ATP-binding cassette domain-containing protein [Eubacteriales bacterium]MDD3881118.1 ATP-binding cassette domain-containing protein [Eubacteriales bacterium]MDD4511500.1 ATP-binding cassette domain-containing protein [Eubacteriales bacterium]